MKAEKRTRAFELKSSAEDGSWFEGIANAKFMIDSYGDITDNGAFEKDLPYFLREGFISGINHDWDEPIGNPIEASEVPTGLYVKGSISDTTMGRDVKVLIKDKVVRKLSIGFWLLEREWLDGPTEVMEYWQSVGYTPTTEDITESVWGARLLKRVKVFEVSPTPLPANSGSDITGDNIKSGEKPRAGVSFDSHSETTLAVVEEYAARIQGLKTLRTGEGRDLSAERKRDVDRTIGRLEELLGNMKALRVEAAPDNLSERMASLRMRELRLRETQLAS